MNILYLIVIVGVLKLLIFFFNRNNQNPTVNSKEISNNCNNVELFVDSKLPNENTKDLGKNKWLYPGDEFVKYQKPKHYKPKNYEI